MRANEFLPEVKIDNRNGWGAVPKNADVDYFGFVVKMKPSMFLALASKMGEHERDATAITQHLEQGGAIGAPFLEINVPDEWRDSGDMSAPAKVVGHDGRHRMLAIQATEGNAPVEVHIFLYSRYSEWRSRHITPEIIQALNTQLIPQDLATIVKQGPFFTV